MKGKRKRPKTKLPKSADSLGAAAAMLSAAGHSVKVSDLQKYKRAGCPAFKSNRVYFEDLFKWLEDQTPKAGTETGAEDIETLEKVKLKEQIRKLRVQTDALERKVIPIEEARQDAIAGGAAVRSQISQFVADLPNLAGLTPEAIHKRGQEFFAELCEELSKLGGKL